MAVGIRCSRRADKSLGRCDTNEETQFIQQSPRDKPFFHSSKSSKGKSSTSSSGSNSLSPAKRIGLRTECINQLDKWHMLLERGAITQEQTSKCRILYLVTSKGSEVIFFCVNPVLRNTRHTVLPDTTTCVA